MNNAPLVFDKNRDLRLRDELDAKQHEVDQVVKKVGQLTIQVDF